MIALKRISRLLLTAACLLTLNSACSIFGDANHPEGFAAYAESVFRHQNKVSSRLMMLNDMDQLPDSESFEVAESQMQNACHLLNEYAEHESDGESMSLNFKSKVQDSIELCDQSIERMEALLISAGLNR